MLPRFGSAAAVWTTSLAFFQLALLCGYALANLLGRSNRYRWAHLALLSLPILLMPPHLPRVELPPIAAVGLSLLLSVGPPFVALSMTSVILQRWLVRSGLPGANDPYFLYGASNAGALLALWSYPLLIEPRLDLQTQLHIWCAGYALCVVLHGLCVPAATSPPNEGDEPQTAQRVQTGRAELVWLLMSAAPNALLMAATQAITLDANVPLLWILPLSIYLLTLIIAFAPKPPSEPAVVQICLVLVLPALLGLALLGNREHLQLGYILCHSSLLGMGCLLCHRQLVSLRPSEPARIGRFYLTLSLGGLLGSISVVMGAPFLGRASTLPYVDYLVSGGWLLSAFLFRDRERLRAWLAVNASRRVGAGFVGLLAIGLIVLLTSVPLPNEIFAKRTFYGVYRVREKNGLRYLQHGNTIHGIESLADDERGEPLSYFHRDSPVAAFLEQVEPRERVAVVGLGAGSLAAYARPGEAWDFLELDPELEPLARTYFGFLAGSAGKVRVIPGDARLSLERVPDQSYDLLILDAFSSDFVPLHLVTREAIELYLRKLRPGGRLLFHLSSRLFDLLPVFAQLAADRNLHGAFAEGRPSEDEARFISTWLALSENEADIQRLHERLDWEVLTQKPEHAHRRVWSDDYLNLFDALRPLH